MNESRVPSVPPVRQSRVSRYVRARNVCIRVYVMHNAYAMYT